MSDIIEKETKSDFVQISKDKLSQLASIVDEIMSLDGEEKSSDQVKSSSRVLQDQNPNINDQNFNKQSLQKPSLDKSGSNKRSLKFEAVKSKLTSEVIEKIFRKFAPQIKNDDEVMIRKNQISKGSLNMNLQNGVWNRFSNNESGDIIRFIELAENISNIEALEILAEEISINDAPSDDSSSQGFSSQDTSCQGFSRQDTSRQDSLTQDISCHGHSNESSISDVTSNAGLKSESQTVVSTIKQGANGASTKEKSEKDIYEPYEIVPIDAPKFEAEKDLAFFIKYRNCRISDSYEYKDINGRLVGYAVRIIEEKTDQLTGKKRRVKQVMPVAYCKNYFRNQRAWKLKGLLLNGYKPFYRIEEVAKHPSKSLLIVEGEKTADAASLLFPDLVVISWLGGSQVIDRVNWSLLKGKEVIIWPDADVPGRKAASNIKDELLKLTGHINYNLVKIVNLDALDLLDKWDLADELPDHLNLDDIHKAVRSLLIK